LVSGAIVPIWLDRSNMSIDTDPHLQEAASPRMVVVRSSLRYVAKMIVRLGCALGFAAFAVLPARAQTPTKIPYDSPRAAYVALSKDAGAKLTRNSEGWQTVHVSEGPNEGVWTFPPSSHSSFPSVVKRQVFEKEGHLLIGMDVVCGGTKPACDQLVVEFTALNEQLAKDINERRPK